MAKHVVRPTNMFVCLCVWPRTFHSVFISYETIAYMYVSVKNIAISVGTEDGGWMSMCIKGACNRASKQVKIELTEGFRLNHLPAKRASSTLFYNPSIFDICRRRRRTNTEDTKLNVNKRISTNIISSYLSFSSHHLPSLFLYQDTNCRLNEEGN